MSSRRDSPRLQRVILPEGINDHIRRALTDILNDHVDRINHMAFETTSIATATTVAHDVVLVDATATATIVVTLVPAALWEDKTINIKKTSDGGTVIIVPQAGETIDGGTSTTVSAAGSKPSYQLISDGENWHVI